MSLEYEPVFPFAESLAELKHTGANLLILGSVPTEAHDTVCKQMFGSNSDIPHCRVAIQVGSDTPPTTSDTPMRALSTETPVYTVHNTSQQFTTYRLTDDTRESIIHFKNTENRSTALREIAIETIDHLERRHDGFSPSELRVCFNVHQNLLNEYDVHQIREIIRSLTRRIRESNGLGHFHLKPSFENHLQSSLLSLFEGIVTLKTHNGTTYQRWQLRDSEITSEWIPIEGF